MKARKKARKKASPFVVLGAVLGTIPPLQAADHRALALPVYFPSTERRITIDTGRLEAALAHVRIWTPSETLPVLRWQDKPVAAQPSSRTFDIPPGPLDVVLEQFKTVTGVSVTLSEDGIRALPSRITKP